MALTDNWISKAFFICCLIKFCISLGPIIVVKKRPCPIGIEDRKTYLKKEREEFQGLVQCLNPINRSILSNQCGHNNSSNQSNSIQPKTTSSLSYQSNQSNPCVQSQLKTKGRLQKYKKKQESVYDYLSGIITLCLNEYSV